MEAFATYKKQVQDLLDRNKANEAEIVRLALSGESETAGISKPRSPRAADLEAKK
jgi:hypothetical protein